MFKINNFSFAFLASVFTIVIVFITENIAPVFRYLALFIIIFILFFFMNKYYYKIQINRLYNLLPSLKNKKEHPQDIKGLSKDISTITQHKRHELDVLYEREMYRREFVGNVAHELKTPLFSIQGYLLTLIEGGLYDEKIRDKYLHRINKSVERLTYIVKDLDLITELESGTLKLDIYPFNIVSLTREVFEFLEIKAEKNKISLGFDKSYKEAIKVKADVEKIEQVLINLVVNAINHSQRKGKVTVSFEVIEDKVKIIISDTGVGIKKEELNRIFERFYRVDKSRSRSQGGSGLGLAIVKHILEAHNEKIEVESTYGEGTSFTFYLEKY
ncbi:ATP-binding protein [Weeksellaceae bacterium TAE3-ERU29]|nr:ATP-binding protein [Weeksellaceae bacterium TAE3-ERU29]